MIEGSEDIKYLFLLVLITIEWTVEYSFSCQFFLSTDEKKVSIKRIVRVTNKIQ